jgi:integrase
MSATARPLSKQEYLELLDYYDFENHPKQHLYIRFAANTGLRVGDALRETIVSNVKFKREFYIIEEKTQKKRRVVIQDELKNLITEYILRMNLKDDDYLFFSNSKKKNVPMQRFGVNRFLQRAGEQLGYQISPHSLRKLFGKTLYDNGTNIVEIQMIMNHSSTAITQRYIGVTDEIIEKTLRNIGL